MAKVKYEDRFESVLEKDHVNIDNDAISWRDAFTMFATDLPGLADKINDLTEDVENLW